MTPIIDISVYHELTLVERNPKTEMTKLPVLASLYKLNRNINRKHAKN